VLALILAPAVARAQAAPSPSGAPSSSSTPSSTGESTSDDGSMRTRTSETGVASRDAGLLGASFPLPGAVDPATYRVGPGDLLILHLWGRVSRSMPLEVGPEGTVLVPGAGPVMVDRRTLSEVRLDLIRRMSRQLRNVEVDLRLARPRTFRIYLTGQVNSPGPMIATGAYRVGDVLTGGMLLEGASRRRIEVLHTDGTRDSCDLDLFLQTGDASLNPWLRDGDMIQVPTATEFVFAQGAVARPGRYELGVRDSARTLLRLAGDPLPSAVVDRVLIVRFRDPATAESLLVSLDDIYDRRRNIALEIGRASCRERVSIDV
jgi:polysaccharide export outer membrane protein